MHERIKWLRESEGLSQTAFGQRIGVSRDVINNLERGRVEIKDYIIKLISTEYAINEDWLRYGTLPMRLPDSAFSLDQFVQEHKGTGLEIEVMKAYFELDPGIRQQIMEHFKTRLSDPAPPGQGDVAPSTPEALEETYPSIEDTGSQVS